VDGHPNPNKEEREQRKTQREGKVCQLLKQGMVRKKGKSGDPTHSVQGCWD